MSIINSLNGCIRELHPLHSSRDQEQGAEGKDPHRLINLSGNQMERPGLWVERSVEGEEDPLRRRAVNYLPSFNF